MLGTELRSHVEYVRDWSVRVAEPLAWLRAAAVAQRRQEGTCYQKDEGECGEKGQSCHKGENGQGDFCRSDDDLVSDAQQVENMMAEFLSSLRYLYTPEILGCAGGATKLENGGFSRHEELLPAGFSMGFSPSPKDSHRAVTTTVHPPSTPVSTRSGFANGGTTPGETRPDRKSPGALLGCRARVPPSARVVVADRRGSKRSVIQAARSPSPNPMAGMWSPSTPSAENRRRPESTSHTPLTLLTCRAASDDVHEHLVVALQRAREARAGAAGAGPPRCVSVRARSPQAGDDPTCSPTRFRTANGCCPLMPMVDSRPGSCPPVSSRVSRSDASILSSPPSGFKPPVPSPRLEMQSPQRWHQQHFSLLVPHILPSPSSVSGALAAQRRSPLRSQAKAQNPSSSPRIQTRRSTGGDHEVTLQSWASMPSFPTPSQPLEK